MSKRNGNNYFILLEEMVECSCQAAVKLENILTDFDTQYLDENIKEMHRIECVGDNLKHVLVEKLVKEFITPIDREDIMAITGRIDDVTDAIEDVLLNIYMFNIQSIHPDAVTFAGIIKRCCNELYGLFKAFSNFKKSKTINASIIELNRLEELGDDLYISSVRRLFTSELEDKHAWAKIYSCLEKVCDTCEHAADLVENVILKNT